MYYVQQQRRLACIPTHFLYALSWWIAISADIRKDYITILEKRDI